MPIQFQRGWRPGVVGWIVGEHGRYYAREWDFGAAFEARVAEDLGAWMKRYDPAKDLLLIASDDEGNLGSNCLDGSGPHAATEGARLRFFILSDRARGKDIGKALLQQTIAFAKEAGFRRIFLTTFAGLDAARSLYENAGFVLVNETTDTTWGPKLREQRFQWTTATTAS